MIFCEANFAGNSTMVLGPTLPREGRRSFHGSPRLNLSADLAQGFFGKRLLISAVNIEEFRIVAGKQQVERLPAESGGVLDRLRQNEQRQQGQNSYRAREHHTNRITGMAGGGGFLQQLHARSTCASWWRSCHRQVQRETAVQDGARNDTSPPRSHDRGCGGSRRLCL